MHTRVFLVIGLVLGGVSDAGAQQRPAAAVDLGVAWVGFTDDNIVNESAVGGAFRWYVTPRIALGPELLYIRGDNHSHVMLTGNLTWDVLPEASRPIATPFVVVGAGMFRTRDIFFDDAVTSAEGAFTAGGGLRSRLGDRVSVGVDARVGWELHVRIGGFVAIRVGR